MSLTPIAFDHPARPGAKHHAQGLALSTASLACIILAFYAGVETLGWRDTGRYAWEMAALLFLLPFTARALVSLFPGETSDTLAHWAPRIESIFIAVFVGSWVMAIGPSVLAGEKIANLALAGSAASGLLLLAMLTTSTNFFPAAGRLRTRIYDLACAGIWTILFFSFLDRYIGPHAPDAFLPTIVLLMVGGVLIRFAASFQLRHPAFFD